MVLANVTLTNTFDEWRTRTNQIIFKLEQVEGNVSNSLANNNANVAALVASTNANVSNSLNLVNTITTQLSANVGNSISYMNSTITLIEANITSNLVNANFLKTDGGTVTGNVIFSTTGNVTFSGADAVVSLL